MLVYEEDKRCYRNIVGDAEWVLLDGLHNQRAMTIYDSGSYKAFEIYCGTAIENIHEMSAVEFIEAVMEGQN